MRLSISSNEQNVDLPRPTTPAGTVSGGPGMPGSTASRHAPEPTVLAMHLRNLHDYHVPIRLRNDAGNPIYAADRRAFDKRSVEYINGLRGLTREEVAQLPQLPAGANAPTDADRWKAALAGIFGYAVAFGQGKLLAELLALVAADYAALAYLLAPILHPLFSEPVAGAIRENYSQNPSLDGALLANYTSLMAKMAAAGNNEEAREACQKELQPIIEALDNRQQQVKGCFSFKALSPELAAFLRVIISDEFPFYTFGFFYTFSGMAQVFERGYLGGDPEHGQLYALLADFAGSAICGSLAGGAYVVTQDWARSKVQQTRPANVGLHAKAVWEWEIKKAQKVKTLLQGKLEDLNDILNNPRDDDPENVKELVEQAIKQNERATAKVTYRMKAMHSWCRRNRLGYDRHFAARLGGKPKNPVPWLNGTPAQRRLWAKIVGNLLAVAGYYFVLRALNNLVSENLDWERVVAAHGPVPNKAFNTTEEQAQFLLDGILATLPAAGAAGWGMITFWCTRLGFQLGSERLLGRLAGTCAPDKPVVVSGLEQLTNIVMEMVNEAWLNPEETAAKYREAIAAALQLVAADGGAAAAAEGGAAAAAAAAAADDDDDDDSDDDDDDAGGELGGGEFGGANPEALRDLRAALGLVVNSLASEHAREEEGISSVDLVRLFEQFSTDDLYTTLGATPPENASKDFRFVHDWVRETLRERSAAS
jgi:hypothetical protein